MPSTRAAVSWAAAIVRHPTCKNSPPTARANAAAPSIAHSLSTTPDGRALLVCLLVCLRARARRGARRARGRRRRVDAPLTPRGRAQPRARAAGLLRQLGRAAVTRARVSGVSAGGRGLPVAGRRAAGARGWRASDGRLRTCGRARRVRVRRHDTTRVGHYNRCMRADSFNRSTHGTGVASVCTR